MCTSKVEKEKKELIFISITYMGIGSANCFVERREGRTIITVDRLGSVQKFQWKRPFFFLARRRRAVFVWVCIEEDIL
jgi:hypothetical protein